MILLAEMWGQNHRLGFNFYIDFGKQSFQTIDDAVSLMKQGYYMIKVDFPHAYRSYRYTLQIAKM